MSFGSKSVVLRVFWLKISGFTAVLGFQKGGYGRVGFQKGGYGRDGCTRV